MGDPQRVPKPRMRRGSPKPPGRDGVPQTPGPEGQAAEAKPGANPGERRRRSDPGAARPGEPPGARGGRARSGRVHPPCERRGAAGAETHRPPSRAPPCRWRSLRSRWRRPPNPRPSRWIGPLPCPSAGAGPGRAARDPRAREPRKVTPLRTARPPAPRIEDADPGIRSGVPRSSPGPPCQPSRSSPARHLPATAPRSRWGTLRGSPKPPGPAFAASPCWTGPPVPPRAADPRKPSGPHGHEPLAARRRRARRSHPAGHDGGRPHPGRWKGGRLVVIVEDGVRKGGASPWPRRPARRGPHRRGHARPLEDDLPTSPPRHAPPPPARSGKTQRKRPRPGPLVLRPGTPPGPGHGGRTGPGHMGLPPGPGHAGGHPPRPPDPAPSRRPRDLDPPGPRLDPTTSYLRLPQAATSAEETATCFSWG